MCQECEGVEWETWVSYFEVLCQNYITLDGDVSLHIISMQAKL